MLKAGYYCGFLSTPRDSTLPHTALPSMLYEIKSMSTTHTTSKKSSSVIGTIFFPFHSQPSIQMVFFSASWQWNVFYLKWHEVRHWIHSTTSMWERQVSVFIKYTIYFIYIICIGPVLCVSSIGLASCLILSVSEVRASKSFSKIRLTKAVVSGMPCKKTQLNYELERRLQLPIP